MPNENSAAHTPNLVIDCSTHVDIFTDPTPSATNSNSEGNSSVYRHWYISRMLSFVALNMVASASTLNRFQNMATFDTSLPKQLQTFDVLGPVSSAFTFIQVSFTSASSISCTLNHSCNLQRVLHWVQQQVEPIQVWDSQPAREAAASAFFLGLHHHHDSSWCRVAHI